MKPRVVAFVPAKGTSDRVSNKNTRIFNGEPFFLFTVRKLLSCDFIDEVYVDSEDEEILELAKNIGANILLRNPELATNSTDGNQLFYNEIIHVDADIYIQHLCTSPFVKEKTIENAINLLLCKTEYDSVVLATRSKHYIWKNNQPTYDVNHIPNSIDLPDQISESMGLYCIRKEAALSTKRRIGNSPCLIFADPMEAVDVNTEEDLALAQIIGAGLIAEEEKRLRIISRFLSSPVLSDVADELGLNCVLPPDYSPNISGAKLFGRARTLHIREALPEDPPDSIYEALESYAHVVSNDIIVVRNDRPDLAYFGDLNMSLAIRSGAIGTIVGGVTRDTRSTANGGFPVFAKGRYCRDIKGRGAVKSINQPIELDGIKICPSDLIFADEDGILVIPRSVESLFLRIALEKIKSEKKLLSDICQQVEVEALVEKYGFF